MTRRFHGVVFALVGAVGMMACHSPKGTEAPQLGGAAGPPASEAADAADAADVIYENGTIVTMDAAGTIAQCLATRDSAIVCVGSGASCCGAFRGRGTRTKVVDLKGATVLPGFIDSHSHMSAWGLFNDPEHWIDISSVNVLLKPPEGDPRCQTPGDYQHCFIPVQSQDDVVQRLSAAAARGGSDPIFGFNYDPSRLGHSKSCKGSGVAFDCQNFEDGTAKAQLDQISKSRRILITSESGHINYANTPELVKLAVCPPLTPAQKAAKPVACHAPIQNALPEMKLAELGQLDEDLSFYASSAAVGEILGSDKKQALEKLVAAIQSGAAVYAQNGFTGVQEGAASAGVAAAYAIASLDEAKFPVTAQILLYDDASMDVAQSVKAAAELKKVESPHLRIAGIKAFADGSNQGYTGLMGAPYKQAHPPFTLKPIFPAQPYLGLPDSDRNVLAADFQQAHAAGLPLMVHQNGDAAIANVLSAMANTKKATTDPRDLLIHFSLPSAQDLQTARTLGAGVTMMIPNLYYYGLPMCHQILDRQRTEALYPTADALKAGLRIGLHADTPVTPPVPLFMVWVARTRKAQRPAWYGVHPDCPEIMGPAQAISILQGLKAFTIDAAYLYGLDTKVGSIEVGKTADLVELSENPLSMEDQPDGLKSIRILGTVHRGKWFANPNAGQAPIWPD